MRATKFALLLILPVLASCGGNGSGGEETDDPLTAGAACNSYADAYCEREATCNLFSLKFSYADQATCVSLLKRFCLEFLDLPGSAETPADFGQCGRQLRQDSCEDWNTGRTGCRFPSGRSEDGAGCLFASQCKSENCVQNGSRSGCGVCRPPRALNEACAIGDDCAPGLYCNYAEATMTSTCVQPAGLNQACDDTIPCKYDLLCAPNGQCQQLAKPGRSCQTTYDCDWNAGYWCAPSGKCETFKLANIGEDCGKYAPLEAPFAGCNGGVCDPVTDVCSPNAREGEFCSEDRNPWQCEFGLECVGGRCALHSSLMCQ